MVPVFQAEVVDSLYFDASRNLSAPYEETCPLCKDSTMHKCTVCLKFVCNFCTEPADTENEMTRKHKVGDKRCKVQMSPKTSQLPTSGCVPFNYTPIQILL